MWLIPGKTKVKLELFKGVGIADILIGLGASCILVFLLISNLPYKLAFSVAIICITVFLIIKIEDEPNYIFLLHIFRYLGYSKHYLKTKDGELLKAISEDGTSLEEALNEEKIETAEERKARIREEKELYKEESKRLRAKDLTKEEEDAIWLARANRSAAKSKAKREKKAKTVYKEAEEITAFTGIKDGVIEYAGRYFGAAIEISPVEFRFFSQMRRNMSIQNGVGKILRSVNPDYSANIVKIERPVHYESYLEAEKQKLEELRETFENGYLREDEYKARVGVVFDRMHEIETMIDENRIVVPFYYLVLFDSDRHQLKNMIADAKESLNQAEINCKILDSKELAAFLKYTNELDVNEKELEHIAEEDYALWATPKEITFRVRTTEVSHVLTHTLRVIGYPGSAPDAWMATVMSMPGTKCVIKAKPMDMEKATRGIDRSLAELRSQYHNTGLDSKKIEIQSHIDSLGELLSMIQGGNETLLEMNMYVTAYDIVASEKNGKVDAPAQSSLPRIANMKKTLRRIYRENGLRLTNLDFEQVQGFIATQVSGYDPYVKEGRGIPANSISAGYPWVFASVCDIGGIKLGAQDGVPVFIDFFRRDSERVNSNMVIVGKSGSGKSFATKSLLTNLAADNSKIFILDPENEYSALADNLHGKFINVGNAQHGRLNPFQIMTLAADDDVEDGNVSGSYAMHLQFLEEFFKQIIPDCDKDAMEYLNSIVDRMYTNRGITAETDIAKLRPEDFPIFDDLYDAILQEFQQTDNDYIRRMLRTLMNYINKFSTGGRNANIWNGPSTITTDENFSVFNFQSLLANRNQQIANAQMLLVLKYIDNEIIKNRDYNTKNKTNRKIIVVIDEAHVFIDEKFPVALDFMFQLAKRIRKYNGMQIVITQNIKDFVGTEELVRKSTAIINACQYSFIFPLAPNDMSDLCKLYEKAGGINESEQEGIVQAPRGQAFTILSNTSRSSFKIEVPEDVRDMFENNGYVSTYFGDDPEDEVWKEYLGESRKKHELSTADHFYKKEMEEVEKSLARNVVSFEEVTEDEFMDSLRNPSGKMPRRTAGIFREEENDSSEDIRDIAFDTDEEENDDEFDFDEWMESEDTKEYSRPVQTQTRSREFPKDEETSGILERMVEESAYTNQKIEKLADIVSMLAVKQQDNSLAETISMEVARQVALALGNMEGTNVAGATASGAVKEIKAPVVEEPAIGGSMLGNIFASASSQEESGDEDDDFDFDSLSELDNIEEDGDDAGDFDILALLAEEAEKISGVSAIAQMEIFDETVIDITLDDLTAYIKSRANRNS